MREPKRPICVEPPELPEWLRAIGWHMDRLRGEPKNGKRFRQVLRDWNKDNAHKSEYQLLPLDDERENSLREQYVLLAAIHDRCCKTVRPIHPWSKLPQISTVGARYFGLMGDVARLTEVNERDLEGFLYSVKRDLPIKIEPVETAGGWGVKGDILLFVWAPDRPGRSIVGKIAPYVANL